MKKPIAFVAESLAWGARIALWPARVAAARAALRALAAMDARELADIGLAPHDLRDVSALALDQDPTLTLAARAAEARAHALARRPAAPARPAKPRGGVLARTGS